MDHHLRPGGEHDGDTAPPDAPPITTHGLAAALTGAGNRARRAHEHGPVPPVAGRGLAANRRWANLPRSVRLDLQLRRDHLLHTAASCEEEIDQITRARLEALEEADLVRERLWPVVPDRKGRRPPAVGEPPIPPIHPAARELAGRSLRDTVRAILRRNGATSLRTLHTLLHHYGYEIASAHPAKTLADALGYETRAGRTVRVSRGTYLLSDLGQWDPGATNHDPPLVDPWLQGDQPPGSATRASACHPHLRGPRTTAGAPRTRTTPPT